MKIALVSFEYPPDTRFGGIATYVDQAATMLAGRGHCVEVFAGSETRSGTEKYKKNILVHRVIAKPKTNFIQAILPVFRERHRLIKFDVVEGPEYGADAAAIVQAIPDLPYVLKLHTPTRFIQTYEGKPQFSTNFRMKLGALRRGIHPFRDLERTQALEADEIASPSNALGEALIKQWQLDATKVHYFPLPFSPRSDLFATPIATSTNRVTYIGRLDIKKGVLDLAQAIPHILHCLPQTQFRFVGANGYSPKSGVDMRRYLSQQLGSYQSSVEFTGKVSAETIPKYLSETDVCVFPSQWESFGLVCLEAMAAGRAVIGSASGGMAEIIHSDDYGRLVPPHAPDAIAAAVIDLLKQPALRVQLGQNARQRVLTEYNLERIAHLQEQSYQRAIARRQQLGPRRQRWLL